VFLFSAARPPGAADANHDGTVTTGELFAYLNAQARKATGNAQHP